jgi:hypothetical protein
MRLHSSRPPCNQSKPAFIFDAVPYKETNSQPWPHTGPDWDHGTSRGVAISTNRNEVVYWAESW